MLRNLSSILLVIVSFSIRPAIAAEDPAQIATALLPFYADLHRHPELSFQEKRTAGKLAAALRKLGIAVTTGVGGTGVVGVLKNGAGPTLLLRSELDALPVIEKTGSPNASHETTTDAEGKTVGVMHACGHDIHLTTLVGTARWMAEHRDRWSGTAVFVGQPAEELVSGASRMLQDGLYRRFPKPDFALALHSASDEPAGTVAYRAGELLASDTSMTIVLHGRGGHGAMPNLTVDPIVMAAALVMDLQTITSREKDPIEPGVVTVGTLSAGTKKNVIPDTATLGLTIRALSPETTRLLVDAVKRHARAVSDAYRGAPPTIAITNASPPLVNDAKLTARVAAALKERLGGENVRPSPIGMASEDFGEYAQGGVPVFMFWLGTIRQGRLDAAKKAGKTMPSLHSAEFLPDPEPAVTTGIRAMSAAVEALLPSPKREASSGAPSRG